MGSFVLICSLSLPSREGSPVFTAMDSIRCCRWRLSNDLSCASQFPSGHGVVSGLPRPTFLIMQCNQLRFLDQNQQRGPRHSLPHTVGRGRGTVPRRSTPASVELTLASLSQARRLGYLLSPHRYLSGACCSPGKASSHAEPQRLMPYLHRARSFPLIPSLCFHGALACRYRGPTR